MSDPPREHRHRICKLLLAWQSSADESDLESLIRATGSLIDRIARATLRRHSISDPDAVDDAVSLVLDHVRRLAGSGTTERRVSPFVCHDAGEATDPGASYLAWLTTERSRDVARKRHRHARRFQPLSSLGSVPSGVGRRLASMPPSDGTIDSQGSTPERIERAIGRLDPRLATVLRMLLDGKPQTVIASTLHVCEGTVSRMRARAIVAVRQLMADEPDDPD